MKKMKYTTGKLKELQTVLEGRAHYLLKKFNCDMVDWLLLASFKSRPGLFQKYMLNKEKLKDCYWNTVNSSDLHIVGKNRYSCGPLWSLNS